jgi:hypothetical protein
VRSQSQRRRSAPTSDARAGFRAATAQGRSQPETTTDDIQKQDHPQGARAGHTIAELACGELDALSQRAKQLFNEDEIADALPILDQIAERTKGKSSCDQIFHLVAVSNLNCLYDKAGKRLLVENREYAKAVLLLEPLIDSFRSQLGTDSKSVYQRQR